MPSVIPTTFKPQKDKFPFPSPFSFSSAEDYWCSIQRDQEADRRVYIKRRHLEENLKTFEKEIGMDEATRKKFLDHWCSPSLRNPELIKAELDECFNLRVRAENWMERVKQATEQHAKSRLEKYAESAQQFYNNARTETIPSTGREPRGFGYADIPDEQ